MMRTLSTTSTRLVCRSRIIVNASAQRTSSGDAQTSKTATMSEEAQYYKHGAEAISALKISRILKRLEGEITVDKNIGASVFVKPQSIYYHLDGQKRKWDMVISHASCATILYHRDRDAAIIVRQFRPAVYNSACRERGVESLPLTEGFTFELCAGILDKSKSIKQIAREECLEECGYDVPLDSIEEVTSFVSASGTSGSRQHMFYAEVDESMRAESGGGGVDGEAIEVVSVPMASLDAFVRDASIAKSPGLMFGLTWLKHVRLMGKH